MKSFLSWTWRGVKFGAGVIGIGGRAFVALIGICGVVAAIANYTMTQGSGTTFGSIVVSTVHYVQMLTCDPTTPTQCGAVTATGGRMVDVATSSNQLHADIIAPPTLGSASAGMTKNYQNALSNTAVAIDAAAGQLYELFCYNPNSSAAFIQIWDTAQGSVTVGTTAPILSYGIPATNSAGFAHSIVGIQFATAITAAATTTSNGGVAPSTALNCNFIYK